MKLFLATQRSNKIRWIACLFIILVSVMNANAIDYPSVGLLYNTTETHSLVYRCNIGKESTLYCEFTQTAVRKKAKASDLDSNLKRARDEYQAGVNMSADECKMYTSLVEVLEGRQQVPKQEVLGKLTATEKKDMVKIGKAFSEFCKSKTENNYLKIMRLSHDKDSRTCKISSHTYKQQFRFVQDNISGSGSWVVQGSPKGPCGIVALSRFEPERLKEQELIFWKYVSRKAITNPQGTLAGASCKGLDEREYVYDWRSKEHFLGCDYMEFSPL